MNTSSIPWNVLSSKVVVGSLTEGWSLDQVESDTEPVRSFTVDVPFVSAFSSVPVVQLGLTGFDIDQRDSGRLSLRTENITEFGFQAVVSTWASTRVYGAEFQWLAIGP